LESQQYFKEYTIELFRCLIRVLMINENIMTVSVVSGDYNNFTTLIESARSQKSAH
jgi:hypothetical protein